MAKRRTLIGDAVHDQEKPQPNGEVVGKDEDRVVVQFHDGHRTDYDREEFETFWTDKFGGVYRLHE